MLPLSRCSRTRVSGLVDDLLAGFTTKAVQQKLDRQVCAKDFDQNFQSPVKSCTQGVDYSKAEVQVVSDVSTPVKKLNYAEGANEQLAKKLEGQLAKEGCKQLAVTASHRVSLSKSKALSLQMELLKAFTAPDFQKKLHELARLHNAAVNKTAEYHLAFRKLVRRVQLPIVERYGFEASEEGVANFLQMMERFREDADVAVNSGAIREALFSASTPANSDEPQVVKIGVKPYTKNGVMKMLRGLLTNYSTPEFQAQLKDLKFFQRDRRYEADGYYHLPGRAELAFTIQEQLLPFFGFEGTKEGVCEMISMCASYLGDPDVVSLFDAINSKLGMTPAACQRFRKVAAMGFAEVKPYRVPATQCLSVATCEPVEV
eukprot:TRINITY_DN4250_c0_g1_i3.p1 TRINITY_DN4250_c0_g1~~TRINITY_DN4250_c0_g1_i3.p1  ORF type:complete len:397 (+),score=88.86 TRINITY_DN4250_c0_g1_i3:74-1192(+)